MSNYFNKTTRNKNCVEDLDLNEFIEDWNRVRKRHKGQKAVLNSFFNDGVQYLFNRAGRKFAKTTTNIDIVWRFAMENPGAVIYYCFPTIVQALEVVWEEKRLQYCDSKDPYMYEKYVKSCNEANRMITFCNGSYCKIIGTWTEARGRGTQPNLLIVDEIQDCDGNYLDAMDANLAAKDGRCVMSGTPPRIRNHYNEWWDRIGCNPRGARFHYTSYDNESLPHLKEWLDAKKEELCSTGKEDVWLREYMAEDCFSSADRVLPDPKFIEKEQIIEKARLLRHNQKIPFVATCTCPSYFCSIAGVLMPSECVFVTGIILEKELWSKSFTDIYPKTKKILEELEVITDKKAVHVAWDSTKSLSDVVQGVSDCRTDIQWQHRGISLLRELMQSDKIYFSNDLEEFAIETQKLLTEEKNMELQKSYPHCCTLAMIANEWFQPKRIQAPQVNDFDKYKALREWGLPVPQKKNGRTLFTINN